MKAFMECGRCGKHSQFDICGSVRCPHCSSDKAKRMVFGGKPPEWFKESVKDNFFSRLIGKR